MTGDAASSPWLCRGASAWEFPRARRHVPIVAFAGGAGLILWFGLLSTFPEPARNILPIRFDLAEHVVAFCWLSFAGLLAWNRTWIVVVGLILSAGLLELAQLIDSLHEASLLDWVASTAGVVFGWALSAVVRRILARRRAFVVQGNAL
ncbi:hypothetical protein [Manganibacter manganicus]|uniref:VanZ-like domain-containing protein n=1 Tax=Manganibacter manganicus TaxID=1873176 RepID=A0A1V8RWZ2_9HYPH|nr:hypothetical protein [Pseudaminobacter manganicus]OQM77579.1 hypothetical protein BFN67_01715 [Pseudaminobacter manganicus]